MYIGKCIYVFRCFSPFDRRRWGLGVESGGAGNFFPLHSYDESVFVFHIRPSMLMLGKDTSSNDSCVMRSYSNRRRKSELKRDARNIFVRAYLHETFFYFLFRSNKNKVLSLVFFCFRSKNVDANKCRRRFLIWNKFFV